MASRGKSNTIHYLAWDNITGGGRPGDRANHTLLWMTNGTEAAPTNAPSEVDATRAPGMYRLVLTASECTADAGTLAGASTTPNVSIVPTRLNFA